MDGTEDQSEEEEAEEGELTNLIQHHMSNIKTYSKDKPRLKVKVSANNVSFNFKALPKTGATCIIISLDLVKQFNFKIHKCHEKMRGHLLYKNKQVQGKSPYIYLIINWHYLVNLGVLPADFPKIKVNKISTLDSAVNELKEEFRDIVTDSLPHLPMKGRPMVIELDESKGIHPKKITTSKKLPLHWEKDENEVVDQLLRDGIIERVADETTDWISRGFFVPKTNGKIRLVTDFTQLKK